MYRPRTGKSPKKAPPFDCRNTYALVELGLFKASDDSIRLLSNPDERYHYRIAKATKTMTSSAAEMYNDSLWFALTKHLSSEIADRMSRLDMHKVFVPLCVSELTQPHTSIYVSAHFSQKDRAVVVFPDGSELGVWSGRLMSQDNIATGSLETFVELFSDPHRGLLIGNPSQIYWKHDLLQAMSYHQFVCAGGRRIDQSTKIPGNESSEAHIEYVLKRLIFESPTTRQISLVVVGMSAYATIAFLDKIWTEVQSRICCIVGISACFTESDVSNTVFRDFLEAHCLNFCASEYELGTMVESDTPGKNISGGHELPEHLPATCLNAVLAFIATQESKGLS